MKGGKLIVLPKAGREPELEQYLVIFGNGKRTRTAIIEGINLEHAKERFNAWHAYQYDGGTSIYRFDQIPRVVYVEMSEAPLRIASWEGIGDDDADK